MCNCGGSSKLPRQGGERMGRQVGPGAPGYTWNGPQTRPAAAPAAAPAEPPAPAKAAPAKTKTTRTRKG